MPTRIAFRALLCAISVLLAGTLSAANESPAPTMLKDVPPLRVQHFGEAQEGRPVVFLPGLNTHRDLWSHWAKTLATAHRVLVVTPAGFPGGLPAAGSGGLYDGLLPALTKLLVTEEIADATLVGASIGGLMALMLANEEPTRIRNVLVVDSLPYLAGLFLPHVTPDQAPAQAKALAQRMRGLPQETYLQEQRAGLSRYTRDPAFKTTLATWLEAADRETSTLAFEETLAMDYRPNLSAIAQPVLVLAAWDADMLAPKAAIERLFTSQYAALPNVEVRVVENSRHFVMVDRPDAFKAALAEVVGP